MRILFVAPVAIEPQSGGSKARNERLVTALEAAGHEVVYLHVQVKPGDDARMLERLGSRARFAPYTRPPIEIPRWRRPAYASGFRHGSDTGCFPLRTIDDVWDPSLGERLEALAVELDPDVVWVQYVFFSRVFAHVGERALKVLDTHDVFARRFAIYWRRGMRARWYSTSPDEEGCGLDRADVALAISDEDRGVLSARTRTPVVTLGHLPVLRRLPPARPDAPTVLYVGSASPANKRGVRDFLARVWPRVRRRVPSARLVLAGGICEPGAVPGAEGHLRVGYVEDLEGLYADATVAVNPAWFGTGLSIKNVEALGFARPLVATVPAARGLRDGAGEAFLEAGSRREFADALVSVLTNPGQAQRLRAAGYRFACRYQAQVAAQLDRVLDRAPAAQPASAPRLERGRGSA